MNTADIVALSKILIAVPTVIGNQKYLDLALEIVHQDLSEYNHKRYLCNNFSSILYYNTKSPTDKFKIILNGQLDVTFAKDSQFKPYVKDGKLYGRGAYDMKSAAAVMILVFKELANKVTYPLALQLTTDQELDSHFGTRYQIEQGVRGDFVINTSTTQLAISNESKGNMRLRIEAQGKRAASAQLWEGKNAILEMTRFLNALEKEFPEPTDNKWQTTINIGKITTTNMDITNVPDNCEVYLDIKYTKEDQATILDKIKKLISKNLTMEVLITEPPHFTPKDNPYIPILGKAIEKVTGKPYIIAPRNWIGSLRHYNAVGGHGASFGPIGGGAHADEEWVDIESLGTYYHALKEFLLSLE